MSLADYAPAKRAPGRKDTRLWCAGKVGRQHVVMIALDNFHASYMHQCGERSWWRGRYFCAHVYRCVTCGKNMSNVHPEQCPDRAARGD